MWMLTRTRKMTMLRRMMLRRKTDPKTGKRTLCEPAQSKCTRTFQKSHFVWKFAGKAPYAKPATPVLCEPAQSKCTRTRHKTHFARKFTGKMPDATDTTSIEHQALTLFVRTPSVWPHCLGNKNTKHHVCGLKSKTPLFVSLNPPYNIINT